MKTAAKAVEISAVGITAEKKEEKRKKLVEDIKNKNKEEQNKIKKDIINKRILKVKKKFKIEDNFETNYAKYKDQTQANNPENKENELDENLKKFYSEIDKYNKIK